MTPRLIPELLNEINEYMEPTLELRCVNRKYYKLYTPEIRINYSLCFKCIDYLNALQIRPTYKALSIYFPDSYWVKTTEKHQCRGYTKKGLRCKRYTCDTFCYSHRNTFDTYKNSKMYLYLTNGIDLTL